MVARKTRQAKHPFTVKWDRSKRAGLGVWSAAPPCRRSSDSWKADRKSALPGGRSGKSDYGIWTVPVQPFAGTPGCGGGLRPVFGQNELIEKVVFLWFLPNCIAIPNRAWHPNQPRPRSPGNVCATAAVPSMPLIFQRANPWRMGGHGCLNPALPPPPISTPAADCRCSCFFGHTNGIRERSQRPSILHIATTDDT